MIPHYSDEIGFAKINLGQVTAGSRVNLRLTYRAGRAGIDDSGGLRIVNRSASDSAPLQWQDPSAPNFLSVTSSNPAIRFDLRYGAKINTRPWVRGIQAMINGGYLRPGEEIRVDYRNWRIQTFRERSLEFKVLVDAFATYRFIELPHSPRIEVVPGKPARLVLVAPSRVVPGERFRLGIRIVDEWGNPCRQQSPRFRLDQVTGLTGLPDSVRLVNGAVRITGLKALSEGVIRVGGRCGSLSAISNPVSVTAKPSLGGYWADLHAQSEETIGTGTVEEYLAFARDYAFLDAVGHQGNDFQITNAFWKRLNSATRRFTRAGRFLAFPGYEWSGNTHVGGDRNVIHVREGGPLLRSSHALVDDLCDVKTDARTADDLFRRLDPRLTLVFAHVGGRFADMAFHDETIERAVEIHSCWGTFEWLLWDALRRGYRVGVVANSDGHKGRPGASHPGSGHFTSYGGLTCILAPSLTRRAVFDAIRARHTYATTGARIGLEVLFVRNGRVLGMMGDVVRIVKGERAALRVSAQGTAPIDRIELYEGPRLAAVHLPPMPGAMGAVKLLWAGSEVRGRARFVDWKGGLRVTGARLQRFDAVNFHRPDEQPCRVSKQEISWNGRTAGGVQGLILHLNKLSGTIAFKTSRKSLELDISKLSRRQSVFPAGGLDARVEACLTSTGHSPTGCELEFPIKGPARKTSLLVKIVQRDGHMAWSSPIFMELN